MDDGKKQLLKDIFWEMNQISSRTESKTETVITETDDGHGNIVETESTVTQTYLYITVSHKTAEEMAAQYGFNEEQKGYLAELLADENNYLWSQVLYGITGGDGQIVTVALSLVGNVGGQPYWSWYGFNSRVEWCACFVSWCANECGYIDAGVIPNMQAVSTEYNGLRIVDNGWMAAPSLPRNDYFLRLGRRKWSGWIIRPYGYCSKGRKRQGLYGRGQLRRQLPSQ